MDRHVAFLRGMNLGGRRITNDELRQHFEALGCDGVATFRASGNVVFESDGRPAELTARLEDGLAEALGLSDSELDLKAIAAALGPTTVRTKGTIDQIAARHFG